MFIKCFSLQHQAFSICVDLGIFNIKIFKNRNRVNPISPTVYFYFYFTFEYFWLVGFKIAFFLFLFFWLHCSNAFSWWINSNFNCLKFFLKWELIGTRSFIWRLECSGYFKKKNLFIFMIFLKQNLFYVVAC